MREGKVAQKHGMRGGGVARPAEAKVRCRHRQQGNSQPQFDATEFSLLFSYVSHSQPANKAILLFSSESGCFWASPLLLLALSDKNSSLKHWTIGHPILSFLLPSFSYQHVHFANKICRRPRDSRGFPNESQRKFHFKTPFPHSNQQTTKQTTTEVQTTEAILFLIPK
jgi:hypothetical protein